MVILFALLFEERELILMGERRALRFRMVMRRLSLFVRFMPTLVLILLRRDTLKRTVQAPRLEIPWKLVLFIACLPLIASALRLYILGQSRRILGIWRVRVDLLVSSRRCYVLRKDRFRRI